MLRRAAPTTLRDPQAGALARGAAHSDRSFRRFATTWCEKSGLRKVDRGLTVDLDDQKRLIGIEILDVRHRLPPDTLATITVQNLLTGTS